jgi:hypothetical protein
MSIGRQLVKSIWLKKLPTEPNLFQKKKKKFVPPTAHWLGNVGRSRSVIGQ